MHAAQTHAARQRLDRLEAFLQQDGDNGSMRVDAFTAALGCGEWNRALAHLEWAGRRHPQDAGWSLRRIDWLLAQGEYARAKEQLEQLRASAKDDPALRAPIDQDLAFIAFCEGRWTDAVKQLKPIAEEARDPSSSLQHLWLRALHRAGELQAARDWAARGETEGWLDAEAAGIAALAAIDLGDFAAASRWCRVAESKGASNMETLVARSTIALAASDAAAARELAAHAVRVNPADGRAWSALAFAEMLAGDTTAACGSFAQALTHMPGHIGTWHGQGWARIVRGDLAGARSSFEQALALDRNFAESHGGLAVVLAMQGDEVGAREHIDLAQRLDRANLSSRYAAAVLSGEARDAQALQRLARALLGARKAPLGGTMADQLPR
jgi:tetratricopeptide (TPR) repeat protein